MINVKEYWNERAATPEAITPGGQWSESVIDRVVKDLVRGIDALSELTVLEIGCGEGRIMSRLAPQVKSYVGVDILSVALARAIELAKSMNLPNITLVELTDEEFILPPFEATFDLVVSWTVFMHLPSPVLKKYFRRMKEYLKPTGSARFQLNCRTSTKEVTDDDRWTGRQWPEEQVREWLKEAGFDVVKPPDPSSECWWAK